MSDRRSINRRMFWRVLRRSVFANRGRLFVMLLALGAGAAITAALLNLQVDAKRRITTEFRSFGANVLVSRRGAGTELGHQLTSNVDSSIYEKIPKKNGTDLVAKAALLYGIASAEPFNPQTRAWDPLRAVSAVVVGFQYYGNDLSDILPVRTVAEAHYPAAVICESDCRNPPASCQVGERFAEHLKLHVGDAMRLYTRSSEIVGYIGRIHQSGGAEDDQVFCDLAATQTLFGEPDRASVIALNVPGEPRSIATFVNTLQNSLPEVDVHPLRQFTDAQARIYDRISGSLTATIAVVLILTALCVMAAMTNVAMERKNDVGLMKAIGGSVRRVLRLFLAEAALLGLAGGLIGAAVGIALSIGLGKAVFGVAAQPRLIVYPVSVALTVMVAILAAYPLRRLAHIRPASVFRGEE